MTTHALKIWPQFFPDVESDIKKFELRRNDRGFKVGDRLLLQEFETQTLSYTGRECLVEVTSYLDDKDNAAGRRGLAPGYCVMSIKRVEQKEELDGPQNKP